MPCTSLHICIHILKHLFMAALIYQFSTVLIIHSSPSLYPPLGFPHGKKCFLEERKVFFPWSICVTPSLNGRLLRYFYNKTKHDSLMQYHSHICQETL